MTADTSDAAELPVEAVKRVVQLTQAVVFLHTRNDGQDARLEGLRTVGDAEVKQIAQAAAGYLETQKAHVDAASKKRLAVLDEVERCQAEGRQESKARAESLQQKVEAIQDSSCALLDRQDRLRDNDITTANRRGDQLLKDLAAAEDRVRSDARWLARHLSGEVARQRRQLDEDFDSAAAAMRKLHVEEIERLKAAKDVAVVDLKAQMEKTRVDALQEENQDLCSAEARCEEDTAKELRDLEASAGVLRASLTAERAAASEADQLDAARQQELDTLSQELQAAKRRAHTTASEADRAHDRRLKAEADLRRFRRQKATLDKSVGISSTSDSSRGGETSQRVPSPVQGAENAVASVAENVQEAQSKLKAAREDVQRSRREIEERKNALEQRAQRVERLQRELLEERQRADDLQRALLRLENSNHIR
eukprot:TRINITY_DN38833_c1_g2_i3.p1 TRINITY_DN38833_c1_g2~~TRINITY_DN38833_c1_g2_i3.p1  ORF type:complete len:424 (+),score=121.48 TRINITY_DN38833_c1_g2_i3:111-1382(+)